METSHRQFIPISLDTMVVAVPPSARYTAVLDLEWTARSLPLLLTSQSRGSVEMTHVEGRHRLREYGVFTRFLIFSPDPDLPSCVDSPTENKSTEMSCRKGQIDKYRVGWIQCSLVPGPLKPRWCCGS